MAKAKKKVTAKKEVVSKIEKVKELFKKIVSWVDSKGFSALLYFFLITKLIKTR